ncbi:hypothetical protein [Variovorax sp.]|uniref:hypothetical protein n=1 Tax=Variovorax sp. TaxID=1871043 RepID=UPI004037832C
MALPSDVDNGMMGKPTRTASQLRELLLERIEALPGMAGLETDIHLGGVLWIDGGVGGPNWTVPVLRSRDQHRADIARVIRQAQMEYDLDAD